MYGLHGQSDLPDKNGQLIVAATLVVLVVMIELERHLWDKSKEPPTGQPQKPT